MPRKKPSNNGDQTVDGKFAPGNKLGKGRREGSRNKATIAAQELLDGEAEELTRKAIEKAKEGDIQALRLCLDRLVPPRKDRPLTISLPDPDGIDELLQVSTAVLQSVASGDITPSEGQALTAILERHRRVVELTDIEARLAILEAKG